jgi:DNA-binding PadR family transcriptional regulator
MAVKHAVLGVLIQQPGNRWSVHRRLKEQGLRHPSATVYSAFDGLLREGLIRETGDAWFEATPEGLEFFEDWMRETVDRQAPPLRSRLLMKLALTSGTAEELAQLHRECVRQEEWCVERMNELEVVDADLEQQLPNAPRKWSVIRDGLLRDAEQAHMTATVDTLSDIRRAAREAYERLTGEPLEPA